MNGSGEKFKPGDKIAKGVDGRCGDSPTGVARNLDRRLRPDIAAIPPHLATDPDLRYFVPGNPGYPSGDVLLCLAPLTLTNWWSVARRMLHRRRRAR